MIPPLVLARTVLGITLLGVSCSPEGSPSVPAKASAGTPETRQPVPSVPDASAAALPGVVVTTCSAPGNDADDDPFLNMRFPWDLRGPGLTLELEEVAALEEQAPLLKDEVRTVPLANGKLLAVAQISPEGLEGYDSLACYVVFSETPTGWRPDQCGLFWAWCCGFGWLSDVEGRVLASSAPKDGPFRCLVRLKGKSYEIEKAFERTLEIDPRADSDVLRKGLEMFDGAPAVR